MSEVNRKTLMHRAMPLILGGSLVKQILVALVLGALTAYFAPQAAVSLGFLGTVFVSALKAVAPVLVFVLVVAAVANQDVHDETHMRPIVVIYLVGTFAAAVTAVVASFLFPVTIELVTEGAKASAPGGILEVLRNLVMSIVDNPVHALLNGNYIGILAWALGMGIALRKASNRSREMVNDISDGVEFIVRVVIRFAPVGIYGLVSNTFATAGFAALVGYVQLLLVLIGCMLFVALVLNPLIVWFCTRRNPYPLTWMTLRESGVTAFFTRSSAANIPVNLNLCRKLGLPESTFGVSIPLGATINMAGAAITITVLALAASAFRWMCSLLFFSRRSRRSAPAVRRACRAGRLCSSPWPAASLALITVPPCRLWPWASLSVCCRTPRKRVSILLRTFSLRRQPA